MRSDPALNLERRRVYRLVSRIYALLNSGEWTLRYARLGDDCCLWERFGLSATTVGFCEPAEQILYIDYRKDVLATIVHECLHAIFEDKDENEILELERMVMRHLTPTQARRLHLIAAEALQR